MTEQQARRLALWGNGDYRARKMHGKWVVWHDAADHCVEFDQRDIDAAEHAPDCRCRECSFSPLYIQD